MAAISAVETAKTYHHGDLRNTLILAAAELIEHSGSVDFAMVEAARHAGVSNAAPYRHFKDKDDLLHAVVQLCFMGLTEDSRAALDGVEVGTEAAIVALGQSYIRYMLAHRPFIDLMWGDHGARAMHDESLDLKGSGFYVLVDAVTALCEKDGIQVAEPLETATQLWSTVHGLSMLAMNDQISRFLPEADVFAMLERSVHTYFQGLRHGAG